MPYFDAIVWSKIECEAGMFFQIFYNYYTYYLIKNINFVYIFPPILGGSSLYPKTFLRYVTNINNIF